MSLVVRMIAVATLLAVAGFGIFGFMATFELLDASTQLTWRLFHGVGILASLAAAVLVTLPRKKGP